MTDSDSLASRLAHLRQRIATACEIAGRAPGDVSLLPVSKTFGIAALRDAMHLGLDRFGENKIQEIAQKQQELGDAGPRWVMIGHLQSNKARDAARLVDEIQSLDRLSLAQALDQRLQAEGRAIDVLVQVKTSPEPSKFGLDPKELPSFLKQLASFDTLRVQGLMTMAVNSSDPAAVRACFKMLRTLRDQLRDDAQSLDRLSMGMSGDFELAIAEGSTEVRVGSSLFGSRVY